MEDAGTAMLEDGLHQGKWIADEANQDIAAVPEGELQGLGLLPRQPGRVPAARAGQRPDARRGTPALAAERDQRADLACTRGRCRRDGGGGVHAHRRHRQAVRRDQGGGVEGPYRTDLAEAAVTELKDDDVDVNGNDWKKETVEVTAGGE